MKSSKKLCVLVASSALILASCGTTGASSTTSTGGESTDNTSSSVNNNSGTSSSGPGTSSQVPQVYQIRVNQVTGATIEVSDTTATPGTTVTITVTLQSGYTLTAILVDNKSISFTGNQATFVMPDYDVTVSCRVSVQGEMTLNGSVTALFEKEGDLYVARNVTVNDDADLYVLIKGEDGTYTPLAYNSLNRYKTFADIGYSSVSYSEANMPSGTVISEQDKNSSLISLAGNAVYDFYYDPSDSATPLYVQRVKVINLPTSYSDYESLFAGTIKSDPATYPLGVTGVTYTDSRVSEKYEWKLYNENASLATVTDTNTNRTKAYVYQEIEDGYLYTVDNYLEGRSTPNLYPDGFRDPALDDSRATDTTAFSSKRKIVDMVEEDYSSYQITTEDALREVATYSHDVYSIDRAQWQAYRDSFNIEDDLVDAQRNVSSVKNDDNTFTVTIDSYKIYNPSRTGISAYNRMDEDIYIEYDIEFTFTEAGAPLSGTYYEMYYDDNLFDFDTYMLNPGAEGNGTLVKALSWNYTYGDTPNESLDFDRTPYFATSITAKVVSGNGNDENVVTAGDWDTQSDEQPLVITASPSTALDAWQYGVISSSDESIIGPSKYDSTVYEAKSSGQGQVTLTIGNHVDTEVTTNLVLNVELIEVHSFYMNVVGGYGDDWHLTSSTAFIINGGTSWTAALDTSPYNGSLENITFSYNLNYSSSTPDAGWTNESPITATVDPVNRTITYTAEKVDVETNVYIKLSSPYYEDGWSETIFTATIYPYDGVDLTEEYITGTWALEMSEDSMDPDLNNQTRLVFNDDHTGVLKIHMVDIDNTVLWDATYSFSWELNTNTSKLSLGDIELISGTVTGNDYSFYSINVVIEATGKIGLAMYGSYIETQDEEWVENINVILGNYGYDDDGYLVASAWNFFVPAE